MLTGDNRITAVAVAKLLGLDEVLADVLPDQKAEIVKSSARGAGDTGSQERVRPR